jgi:uncharacterized protein
MIRTVAAEPTIQVEMNSEASRYELLLDGEPTGFLDYRLGDGTIALTHAEVEASKRGLGFGRALAAGAIADAAERGLKVIPRCPFVVAYVARHPEVVPLLAK